MIPDRSELELLLRKGADFVQREAGSAPEHREARKLAHSLKSLGVDPDGEAKGRRILFLTPRDWAFHVAVDGVLASALRQRGASVAFISCGGGLDICDRANVNEGPPMPCRSCTKYVDSSIDAFDFQRFPLRTHWEDTDTGAWPELDEMSPRQLEDVEFDGLPLGRLMQVPSKWFLLASRADWDPLSPQMTRKFLISARRVAIALGRIFDEFQPDTVVMLSGLFSFESVALAMCKKRGIDGVTYERTYRPGHLIFRRNAPASHYEVTETWERFRDTPLTAHQNDELDRYIESRRASSHPFYDFWKGASDPSAETTDGGSGKTAVLFTNVTWDSAVIGRERAFGSIHEWIDAAIDAIAHRPNDRLIIRIHPAESKMTGKQTREPIMGYLEARHTPLPSNVLVIGPDEPVNSYPLMEACDVGLTLTSIVGLELALLNKPVVVTGRPHYSKRGFTLEAHSPEEFRRHFADAMARPTEHVPDMELARRYAYTFFFRATVAFDAVSEPVPGLARLRSTEGTSLVSGASSELDRLVSTVLSAEPQDRAPAPAATPVTLSQPRV